MLRSLLVLAAVFAVADGSRLRKHHRQVPGANDLKAVSAELADAKATLANAKKLDAIAVIEKTHNHTKEAKMLEDDAKEEVTEATKEMDEASSTTKKARADIKAANTTKAKATNATKAPSAKKAVNISALSEEAQLAHLQAGLNVIQKLKSVFASAQQDSASKFANGAMSDEMSNQNSAIWGAIDSMMSQAKKVSSELKGKSKAEKEKLMDSLENSLNSKAHVLSGVTQNVEKKQQGQDEEYVLGLLMSHKDWSLKEQLNATHSFIADSPVIAELYKHHDDKKPLSAQLAIMMDAEHANATKNGTASKISPKSSTAAKMFLQLANSLHRMRA
jgi:hypothetical protein